MKRNASLVTEDEDDDDDGNMKNNCLPACLPHNTPTHDVSQVSISISISSSAGREHKGRCQGVQGPRKHVVLQHDLGGAAILLDAARC